MGFKIVESTPYLLGIELERPFSLGFGTLDKLPRVLYRMVASDGRRRVEGVGEASIDFPFTSYDAWDTYHSLLSLDLRGEDVNKREEILLDKDLQTEVLCHVPAGFAALNMALDDLFGKVHAVSVADIYGRRRRGGVALASLPFAQDVCTLVASIKCKVDQGLVPKIKMGQDIETDAETLLRLGEYSRDPPLTYALDFNARYDVPEFMGLVEKVVSDGYRFEGAIFLEQPTTTREGIGGLAQISDWLEDIGAPVSVMADESFVTAEHAVECAGNGLLLNFKVHKIGGGLQAVRIEKALESIVDQTSFATMVGGTFPTAIGRAYDQHVASVLRFATLPGDGWEPSSDWFHGRKHLILETFRVDNGGLYRSFPGPGLGITPDWRKINTYVIVDPLEEYRALRQGKSGSRLTITLRDSNCYRGTYESLSGRAWNWNL